MKEESKLLSAFLNMASFFHAIPQRTFTKITAITPHRGFGRRGVNKSIPVDYKHKRVTPIKKGESK